MVCGQVGWLRCKLTEAFDDLLADGMIVLLEAGYDNLHDY
jgi:hypothetical protein